MHPAQLTVDLRALRTPLLQGLLAAVSTVLVYPVCLVCWCVCILFDFYSTPFHSYLHDRIMAGDHGIVCPEYACFKLVPVVSAWRGGPHVLTTFISALYSDSCLSLPCSLGSGGGNSLERDGGEVSPF